jgi:hypothetical protein
MDESEDDKNSLAQHVLSIWNPHIAAFAQLYALSFGIQLSGDKPIKIGIKVVNHSRYVVFPIGDTRGKGTPKKQ